MSSLTAQEVLVAVGRDGVQVKLTEDFDLDVFPSSKLQPSHREMLKLEKPKLVKHLARQAAKKLLLTADRDISLFNLYYDHHFQCPQCIAAVLGYGSRCLQGKPLWFRYQLESYCEN